MSEDGQTSTSESRGLDYRLIIAGGVVVALVILVAVSGSFGPRAGSGPRHATAGAGATLAQPPADTEEVTLAMAHAEARAVAAAALADAEAKIAAVSAEVEQIESLLDEWMALRSSLLESEDGRRIAASDTLTEQFLALYDVMTPARVPPLVAGLRERVTALQEPLEDMRSEPSNVHTPESLTEALQDLRADVEAVLIRLRQQVRAMHALVERASEYQPSDRSLADAINIVGGTAGQAHADRLAQIREEGERQRQANLEELEQRRQRLAAITTDPRAVEILSFVTSRPNYFWEAYCGKAFHEFLFFQRTFVAGELARRNGLRGRSDWNYQTEDMYEQLDNQARAAFDMSLHELFRVFMLSERNQDKYTISIERMREMAKGGSDVSRETAKNESSWLQDGRPLPDPILP